jgi:hypothetical protein
MPTGTLYRIDLVRTDVSENISALSSWFLRAIGFQLYCGITVVQPLHRGILFMVEEPR